MLHSQCGSVLPTQVGTEVVVWGPCPQESFLLSDTTKGVVVMVTCLPFLALPNVFSGALGLEQDSAFPSS